MSLSYNARESAYWLATCSNAPPSTHRLWQAAFMTVCIFAGDTVGGLLTGRNATGEKNEAKDYPFPVQFLHGIFPYNPYSDAPGDRVVGIARTWGPALAGVAGGVHGSYKFAREGGPVYAAAKAAEKDLSKLTAQGAEQMAKIALSEPIRYNAGYASMFGSGSGLITSPLPLPVWLSKAAKKTLNLPLADMNYGGSLGSSFLFYTPRDKFSTPYFKPLQEYLSGNKHYYPFGPSTMLTKLGDYLLHNPEKRPQETYAMAASVLEPWWGKEATPERVGKFVNMLYEARDPHFVNGKLAATGKDELKKALDGLLSPENFDKTVHKTGIDVLKAQIGRYGWLEQIARANNIGPQLDRIQEAYRKAAAARLGIPYRPADLQALRRQTHPEDAALLAKGEALTTAALGATGLAIYAGRKAQLANLEAVKAAREKDSAAVTAEEPGASACSTASQTPDGSVHAVSVDHAGHKTAIPAPEKDPAKPDHSTGFWLADRALDLGDCGKEFFNSLETKGTHRVSCGVAMWLMGMLGMTIGEAVTGRTLAGAAVSLDKVPESLHPLYKACKETGWHYNPNSNHARDRLGFVVNMLIPTVMAAVGVLTVSNFYFRNRTEKNKEFKYLDDAEDAVTGAESNAFTLPAAIGGSIATPSANIFLPVIFANYGLGLGLRFAMAAGNKVAMPGIGKFLTGSESMYAQGPVKLRDRMIQYAVNNPDPHPEQLEAMAIGMLKPMFEDVTPEQINAFVARVEHDREKFLREGGIPENLKDECEKVLISHFKGAGLENTLREICAETHSDNLDPLRAKLGNNGFAASFARWMGSAKEMDRITHSYHDKYTARLQQRQESTPATMAI